MTDQTSTETAAPPVTPFDQVGGEDAARRIASRLYDVMATDPRAARIRAMHGDDLSGIKDLFGEFFMGWLGGPRTYFQRDDRPCMMSAHSPYAITESDRDAWLFCMKTALDEEAIDPALREAIDAALRNVADAMVRR